MGDGHVVLILDVPGIGQTSGVLAESRQQERKPPQQLSTVEEAQRLLLFSSASFKRLALPLSFVSRIEEFPVSSIERAGGGQAVQYRGKILPLVLLSSVLEPGSSPKQQQQDPAQVIVLNDVERSVGIIVDGILDIAEDTVSISRTSSRPGLLGSAVISKRVTDFLDPAFVLMSAGGERRSSRSHVGALRSDESQNALGDVLALIRQEAAR
jgi:two-component system chemotaxis sensor kinase CheA